MWLPGFVVNFPSARRGRQTWPVNVRHVYAADADDALQTHALHYPGERILSWASSLIGR
jgi:hypothetical protein